MPKPPTRQKITFDVVASQYFSGAHRGASVTSLTGPLLYKLVNSDMPIRAAYFNTKVLNGAKLRVTVELVETP